MMRVPELPDELPDALTVDRTRRPSPWLAPAITVALTVCLDILVLPLWILLILASSRFDASGSGGPFRSCTPDSSVCSGPQYVWIIVVLAALLGGALLVASVGAGMASRLSRSRVPVRATASWSVPLVMGPAALGVAAALVDAFSAA